MRRCGLSRVESAALQHCSMVTPSPTQNGASCKYAPAPAADTDLAAAAHPDKSARSCCQRCALGGCVLGLLLLVTGVICAFILKSVVNTQIVDNMVLFEGGQAFNSWRDPPVNPVMKIYFFNLTNKEAFLGGLEKPRVSKVGPYVYIEQIEKVDTSFDEAGDTVTFSDKKFYHFSAELSNGTDSDLLLMPNLPMFGAFRDSSSILNTYKTYSEEFAYQRSLKVPLLSMSKL